MSTSRHKRDRGTGPNHPLPTIDLTGLAQWNLIRAAQAEARMTHDPRAQTHTLDEPEEHDE